MNETPRPINVPDPKALSQMIGEFFVSNLGLIHMLREKTMHSHTEDGCQVFDEEFGPLAFQATMQYERPKEFLQTLLDLIRIIFEPHPPGTLLLNANIGLMINEVGSEAFQLGYLSAVSDTGESFGEFAQRAIEPRIQALGYRRAPPNATFFMLTYGDQSFEARETIREEICKLFSPGFQLNELITRFAETVQQSPHADTRMGRCYAGYSQDSALGPDRFRLSVWLFLPLLREGISVY